MFTIYTKYAIVCPGSFKCEVYFISKFRYEKENEGRWQKVKY